MSEIEVGGLTGSTCGHIATRNLNCDAWEDIILARNITSKFIEPKERA